MKVFTKEIEKRLRANAAKTAQLMAEVEAPGAGETDFEPVVKVFTPDAGATWLFTELDEDDMLFGLCDLGLGFPEMGSVSLEEIQSLRGRLGLPVERDVCFEATAPLSAYAEAADKARRIVSYL